MTKTDDAESEGVDIAERLLRRLEFCAVLAHRAMQGHVSPEAKRLVYQAIRSELPECDLDAGLCLGFAEDDEKRKREDRQ